MNQQPRFGRDLPPQRKGIYTLGLTFIIMGGVVLLSAILSMAPTPGETAAGPLPWQSNSIRLIGSIGFIILGSILMRLARSSGAALDRVPDSRKRPPEPWRQVLGDEQGGMLEGTELDAALREGQEEVSISGLLARLDQLHADGRVTEETYQVRRADILAGHW